MAKTGRITNPTLAKPEYRLTTDTEHQDNHFYDMYNYQEIDDLWKSYHFDYKSSPFLDISEIERIKHTVDPQQWASEYLASFVDSGNSVFYCFDRAKHVRKDLEYFMPPVDSDRGEDVHVAIDFNIGKLPILNWVNSVETLSRIIPSQAETVTFLKV